MTKQRAQEIWDEWKWWLALVVFPLVVWGARAFDDSKVSTRRFDRYSDSLAAADILRDVKTEAHQEVVDRKLSYVICRIDGGTLRQCGHLR